MDITTWAVSKNSQLKDDWFSFYLHYTQRPSVFVIRVVDFYSMVIDSEPALPTVTVRNLYGQDFCTALFFFFFFVHIKILKSYLPTLQSGTATKTAVSCNKKDNYKHRNSLREWQNGAKDLNRNCLLMSRHKERDFHPEKTGLINIWSFPSLVSWASFVVKHHSWVIKQERAVSLFIDVVQRDFLEAFFWLAAFFGDNNKLELQKYNGEHVCTVDVNYRHRNMTDRNVFSLPWRAA